MFIKILRKYALLITKTISFTIIFNKLLIIFELIYFYIIMDPEKKEVQETTTTAVTENQEKPTEAPVEQT